MAELDVRAVLEAPPDVGEGLTTSLPRSEVEEALAVEDVPLELVLDLTRFSDGDPTETRKVTVAWERSDLERILQDSEGDRVDFIFDRETLWQAMEGDVEAHGIRETVLVLAVAVTAASGAAAKAAAEPGPYYGAGGPAVHSIAPDDRAFSRAIPTPEPSLSPDDRAVSRAIPTPPTPEPSLSPDDRAVSRALPGVATSESLTAADAGSSWAPGPAETAAIGGAIALAITGAAFVATGRRRGRLGARPA
jgi:hypothetical protein